MKILHTAEWYWPSVGGAQEVIRQISRRLVQRGHEVTVATSAMPHRGAMTHEGVTIEPFHISGNAALGLQGEVKRYQQFLREGAFDIMLNYAAQQWTTDAALEVIPDLPYACCLATCGFSGLNQPAYTDFFTQLPKQLATYDQLICHSATYQDYQFLKQHDLTSQCTVIPNGCGKDEFGILPDDFRQRHDIAHDKLLVLSLGSHTGLKGHEFAIEAFAKAKLNNACLLIVGNTPPGCFKQFLKCKAKAWSAKIKSLGRLDIRLVNLPRHDVLGAYHAADLLLLASQVEAAPLVLYEAAASATPFLSSEVGNAHEIAEQTGGGIIIPTAQQSPGRTLVDVDALAQQLRALASDPERRQAMGQSGRRAWMSRFTWDCITDQYESLYHQLIDQRKA